MKTRFWLAIIATAAWSAAIALNLSPWLRGPEEWRWPYVIPGEVGRVWLCLLLLLLYLLVGGGLLTVKRPKTGWMLLLSAVMIPFFQLSLLYVDHPDPRSQLFLRTVSPEAGGFFNVGATVTDTPLFLSQFADNMASYPVHPQRHPPGLPLLFAQARHRLDGQPQVAEQISDTLRGYQCHNEPLMNSPNSAIAAAILQMLMPLWLILTLPLLYVWGRLVGGEQTAVFALFLYPLLPSIGLWSTRWNHLYALFALAAMILFHLGLTRRRWLYFLLAGVVVSIASFFSFGNVALLLFLGVYALVWLWREHGTAWRRWRLGWHAVGAVLLMVGVLFAWVVAWLAFDLRLTAVWQEAMGTHLGLGRSYQIWLFYHLYDFFIYLGVPLLVLWLVQAGEAVVKDNASVAWIAFAVGLLLLNLSGTSQGEVARVWAFLLPIALVAIAEPLRQPNWILLVGLLLGLQTAVANVFLRPVGTGLLDPPTLPVVAEASSVTLSEWEDGLRLIDQTLVVDEESLTLTSLWQTVERPDRPYTLFVHLVDENGRLVAQADALTDPLTTCWAAKRPFTTRSTLELPREDGRYTLQIGWYWFPTLERLPRLNGENSYSVQPIMLP